jgi:hypothetical protein
VKIAKKPAPLRVAAKHFNLAQFQLRPATSALSQAEIGVGAIATLAWQCQIPPTCSRKREHGTPAQFQLRPATSALSQAEIGVGAIATLVWQCQIPPTCSRKREHGTPELRRDKALVITGGKYRENPRLCDFLTYYKMILVKTIEN